MHISTLPDRFPHYDASRSPSEASYCEEEIFITSLWINNDFRRLFFTFLYIYSGANLDFSVGELGYKIEKTKPALIVTIPGCAETCQRQQHQSQPTALGTIGTPLVLIFAEERMVCYLVG